MDSYAAAVVDWVWSLSLFTDLRPMSDTPKPVTDQAAGFEAWWEAAGPLEASFSKDLSAFARAAYAAGQRQAQGEIERLEAQLQAADALSQAVEATGGWLAGKGDPASATLDAALTRYRSAREKGQ